MLTAAVGSPPPLTARGLSRKPTFAALHSAVAALTNATGFGKGLFTAEEQNIEHLQTAEQRRQWVGKITGLVGVYMGAAVEPKPIADAVLVTGSDPKPLGVFLLSLAKAAGGSTDSTAGHKVDGGSRSRRMCCSPPAQPPGRHHS